MIYWSSLDNGGKYKISSLNRYTNTTTNENLNTEEGPGFYYSSRNNGTNFDSIALAPPYIYIQHRDNKNSPVKSYTCTIDPILGKFNCNPGLTYGNKSIESNKVFDASKDLE